MAYLTEAEPLRAMLLPVIAGVGRVVANNPSMMTYHGTNTYLIESPDGLFVLDPGPNEAPHLDAVASAAAGRAKGIILSHGHSDHYAGAAKLREMLDVPVYGYRAFIGKNLALDVTLEEGDHVGGMEVLHTPGHASDHICLARSDGVVFTGDHIMAWSSSVVPFPNGSMADFLASLERMADRKDTLYLCGHGPVLPDPSPFIRRLIHHRLAREGAVLQALRNGLTSAHAIAQSLYQNRGPHLQIAAEHNVNAHLAKLIAEGRVMAEGDTIRARD